MSRLDELKKQYPQLNMSFFDIMTRLDKSKSYKYLPLLCKLFSKRFDFNHQYSSIDVEKAKTEHKSRLKNLNISIENLLDKELMVLLQLTEYWSEDLFETFNEFQNRMENSLIENTDVTKYNTLNEIRAAISISELKMFEKDMENQVIKEYEDDTWLFIRPLTFSSSLRYGSGTKWCTTSKKEKSYFESYWRRGSLIYYLNKKSGYKFASFRNFEEYDKELSFWNAEDNRIDFMSLEIDDYIFPHIRKIISVQKTNKSFCTNEIIESVENECLDYRKKESENLAQQLQAAIRPIFVEQPLRPLSEIQIDLTIANNLEGGYESDEAPSPTENCEESLEKPISDYYSEN